VHTPFLHAVDLRIPRFVDIDIFMRFRSRGVGYKSTRTKTRCLFDDRDELDKLRFEREKSGPH